LSRRACPARHGSGIRFRIEAPQVSWLGDSLRLLLRCRKSNRSSGAAFPLRPESRDSELRTVARAENFRLTVARRRRLSTVFPCAESLVIVDGAGNYSAPLAKANRPPRLSKYLHHHRRCSASSNCFSRFSNSECSCSVKAVFWLCNNCRSAMRDSPKNSVLMLLAAWRLANRTVSLNSGNPRSLSLSARRTRYS
jgi:hypothetical protein